MYPTCQPHCRQASSVALTWRPDVGRAWRCWVIKQPADCARDKRFPPPRRFLPQLACAVRTYIHTYVARTVHAHLPCTVQYLYGGLHVVPKMPSLLLCGLCESSLLPLKRGRGETTARRSRDPPARAVTMAVSRDRRVYSTGRRRCLRPSSAPSPWPADSRCVVDVDAFAASP